MPSHIIKPCQVCFMRNGSTSQNIS